MNAKYFLTVVLLFVISLTACTAPAAPTQSSTAGRSWPTNAPKATEAPAAAKPVALPTAAPAATQAPASVAQYAATPVASVPMPPTPAPTPADNFFATYGVNPFVDTSEDHLSTFALDVDTASYTVARRYVLEGNAPPPEAIRVEEFVNYFKQDYPLPPDVAFGIYADGAPSPFNRDGSYLVRVGIQGYDVPESQRKPLVLTFVIDVSGSMAEQNRLEMVKQSLQLLVDRLRPSDQVAIVAYTTDAWVVLNPIAGNNRDAILNAIYALQPMSTTNVEGGLKLGYQLAWEMRRPEATNRVILCSDGVANVGATRPDAILEFVRGYADQGITLTSIGVGMGNFNDVLLEQLADKGDGNYAYVDTLDEARRVFVDDLVSTMQVIALDAKVQVDFNTDVVARYRLIGYENRAVADQDFRNDAVDAGEIGAGHTATALYAVQLRPGVTGRLATVQLRWQDPASRHVREINGNFNTWDLSPNFESAAARYQLAATVAQYAELLRHSPWAEGTTFRDLNYHAARLARAFPEDADVQELAKLVSIASELKRW